MSNTGDHTEKLRSNDVAVKPSDELVSTVEEKLAETYVEVEVPERSEASTEQDDSTLEKTQEVSGTEQDDSTQASETKEVKEVENKDDANKEEKTLSYAYEQAALRNGWSKEDIDDAYAQNPERAEKMFGNLYNSVNQASRDFAAIGRAKIAADVSSQQQQQQVSQTSDDNNVSDTAIGKLRDENPELADALNAVLKEVRVNKVVQTPQVDAQATQRANTAEEYAMRQRIDSFFGADAMNPYDKFYGKLDIGQSWEDLSGGQRDNRWRVLKEADAIVAGYASIGQNMEPEDAMARAHLLVSDGIREKVIRDKIKDTATKRSNSITMKPSSGKRTTQSDAKFDTGDSKPRNRKELEAQVGQNLLALFGAQK